MEHEFPLQIVLESSKTGDRSRRYSCTRDSESILRNTKASLVLVLKA